MSENSETKSKEVFLEGIAASPGVVTGLAYIHNKEEIEFSSKKIEKDEIPAHLEYFDEAQKKFIEQWRELQKKQTDSETKKILDAQIEIIRDPELSKRVKTLIKKKRYNVRRAIQEAFEEYIDFFAKSASPVIADRLVDLTDIRDRLIEAAGGENLPSIEKEGDIVVAGELSPRQIIALSHQNIKGIVTERGGSSSHAAIIARSVGIPAVSGAAGATEVINDNANVFVNGNQGIVCVNPSPDTYRKIEKLTTERVLGEKETEKLCRHSSVTKDGHSFTLRANIEFSEELIYFQRCKAEGVGLLRTEALYLNRNEFGGRKDQQAFYEDILGKTSNHPVTIRLFDVGGDKFQTENITESNPFLGWRGIRMLLDERDLLREQLMAILATAGNHPGRVKLLLPMVTMTSEIEEVKKEIERCQKLLIDEDQPVDRNLPLGIMVETPNVALQAKYFAKEVDFFSIGTNDLIQYLLAVDRGNARISKLYNQLHPVMWQMIDKTIKAAHQQKISVEVCGELASYPAAAACLVGMNIDGLSMNPAAILPVKKLLINRNFEEMKALASETLQCNTFDEVELLFEKWKKHN